MERWDGRCPVVIVPTTYHATPTEIFRQAGVSTVIWANHTMRAAVTAMRETAERIYRDQSAAGDRRCGGFGRRDLPHHRQRRIRRSLAPLFAGRTSGARHRAGCVARRTAGRDHAGQAQGDGRRARPSVVAPSGRYDDRVRCARHDRGARLEERSDQLCRRALCRQRRLCLDRRSRVAGAGRQEARRRMRRRLWRRAVPPLDSRRVAGSRRRRRDRGRRLVGTPPQHRSARSGTCLAPVRRLRSRRTAR